MYDEDLTNLEDWLRRLKVEYDIFFHGNRKKPPDDLKMRVDRLVKKLSEAADMSIQERFRYNTLVGRLCVYRDLWRRTLQDKELAFKPVPTPSVERPSVGSAIEDTSCQGISVSIVDPRCEEEKVKELYNLLLRIAGGQAKGQQRISFQQFTDYIARQIQNIRGRYGCTSVVFSIGLEADTIKFTARAGSQS